MDGRSDQFSLAVLAHLMLTGELPFGGTPLGVLFRIAYQGLERDAMRDLPAAAQAVFRRSLAKLPAERYATCGAMVDAFENALLRPAVAPTRVADVLQFTPAPALPADGARAQQSWAARNFTGEALKYFGVTFAVCALILAAVFYFLLPGKVRPNPVPVVPAVAPAVAPAVTQPGIPGLAPAVGEPAIPQEPAQQAPAWKAKTGTKSHGQSSAKKKTEPEVEYKPVEPKIIRQ
jgi:hypothetical protein